MVTKTISDKDIIKKLQFKIKRLERINERAEEELEKELQDFSEEMEDWKYRTRCAEAERNVLAEICAELKIDDGDNPTERWCPKEHAGVCMRCYIIDPGEDEWCEQGIGDINCWLKWAVKEVSKREKEGV